MPKHDPVFCTPEAANFGCALALVGAPRAAGLPDGEQILRELLAIVDSDAYAMTALTLGGYRANFAKTIISYINLFPQHDRNHRQTGPEQ